MPKDEKKDMQKDEGEKEQEQEKTQNATIAGAKDSKDGAEGTAEDPLKEYKGILDEMKAQNAQLLEANKSLQSQIGILMRNGASVGQKENSSSDPKNTKDSDEYVSLADLGKEIGKQDK